MLRDCARLRDYVIGDVILRDALVASEYDCREIRNIVDTVWPETARLVCVYTDCAILAVIARFEDDSFPEVSLGEEVPRTIVGDFVMRVSHKKQVG